MNFQQKIHSNFFYVFLKIKECERNFKLFKDFKLNNIDVLINLFLTLKIFERFCKIINEYICQKNIKFFPYLEYENDSKLYP